MPDSRSRLQQSLTAASVHIVNGLCLVGQPASADYSRTAEAAARSYRRRRWRHSRDRDTRVRGGFFRARDGRAQRCLRRRQIRLKKSQAACTGISARRSSMSTRCARAKRCCPPTARLCADTGDLHRPQPEGQVHGPRRHHREDVWWGGNQSITAGAVRGAVSGLPQARRRQDAVRAGSLWRRRSELPDQDPRLHRTRLALAVHPHAADPARDARSLRDFVPELTIIDLPSFRPIRNATACAPRTWSRSTSPARSS